MQAGFALPGRGLQPDGERRIPDLMLNLHQPHGNGEYRFIFRSPRRGAMFVAVVWRVLKTLSNWFNLYENCYK
jgi:hypothetical protein